MSLPPGWSGRMGAGAHVVLFAGDAAGQGSVEHQCWNET